MPTNVFIKSESVSVPRFEFEDLTSMLLHNNRKKNILKYYSFISRLFVKSINNKQKRALRRGRRREIPNIYSLFSCSELPAVTSVIDLDFAVPSVLFKTLTL